MTAPLAVPSAPRTAQLTARAWYPQNYTTSGVLALPLGGRVKKLGEGRSALTDAQFETLDGLLENDRVPVKGGAGCDKTLLAAEAARRAYPTRSMRTYMGQSLR